MVPAVAGDDCLRKRGWGRTSSIYQNHWHPVTATQVYTIFNIHPLLADEIVRRGAISGGLTWHFARPPVQGLDFEMDVRGVAHELVI